MKLFKSGCDLFFSKSYEAAVEQYAEYFRYDSIGKIYEAYAFMAQCYNKLGDYQKGKELLSKAVRIAKDSSQFLDLTRTEIRAWNRQYPDFPSELEKRNGFNYTDIEPPVIIETVYAIFPSSHDRERTDGRVVIRMLIDEKGKPIQFVTLSSIGPDFEKEALRALQRFRFSPAKHFGRPRKVWVTYPFRFKNE